MELIDNTPIIFTTEQIENQINRLSPVDKRLLPKFGKGGKHRTGFCAVCGSKSHPYSLCRKHRESNAIRRVLNKLVGDGEVERVTDGRGKKGGAKYRAIGFKIEKKQPFVRNGRKIGRNDICRCGSGNKNKKCCGE